MDIPSLMPRPPRGSVNSLTDLPEYIITTFVPGVRPLLAHYPRLFRFVGILLAFYYLGLVSRLKALWSQCSSLLVSSIRVTSDEDLFGYLNNFLATKQAIRPNLTINAITNPIQDQKRHRYDPDYEESAQRNPRKLNQVDYEQGQGMEIFFHNRRLFWVSRVDGDGYSYYGNKYKKQEVLVFHCLGRSTEPIKDLLQDVYRQHKESEKSLTVIRRPYGSGYGSRLTWSRLTAKRRRQLDTVILQESQTAAILADMEEYMSETTKTFYANHGIPYRRGYLFHGPPGCGKTSFCLALASRFDLDVYILTLLDKDINDTDLISLLNQLPTPSLLLLEDIDEAGLSRKSKAFAKAARKKAQSGLPEGVVPEDGDDAGSNDDDDEEPRRKTRVTLSGLLNAIDGVAAPEGHILIMTTNKPHELDDALVRAGRISVHVQFANANQKQGEQIFQRMYVDQYECTENSKPLRTKEEVDALAVEFGAGLPADRFSPADLQDYLLLYKRDPQAAVTNLSSWLAEKEEEKRRKEEENEAEARWKLDKVQERRRKWKADLKKAVKEAGEEGAEALIKEKEKEVKEKEKAKDSSSDIDSD